jgi:hypothetical protein
MQNKSRLIPVVLLLSALLLAVLTLIGTSPDRATSSSPEDAQAVANPATHSSDEGFPADSGGGSAAQSAQAVPAAVPVAGSAPGSGLPTASGFGSPAGSSAPTGVPQFARVSPGFAAANPVAPVLDPANTPAWPTGFSILRTPAEILAGKDLTDPAQRAQAVAEMSEAEEVRYAAVLAKAEQMGIPVRIDGPDHQVSILHDIRKEGPLYRHTLNTNAAISTGADLIRQTAPYNLDGSGVKVGVWDAGSVLNTHQEFRTNRVTKRNASVATDDHATHVTGTIAATGVDARAKGMAPAVAVDSYDWNSDYSEMTAAGAASAGDSSRIPISNHSYGYGATNVDMGRYETEAATTDALARGLPFYLVFWAAGNEQDELTALGGYQSITFVGLAKNILTIGAVNDAVNGGVRSPTNGTMSTFSSWGPCDDGRIKPDLVANGVSLYSTIDSATNAYAQTGWSGTSMASPNAAGSAVLLQQLYRTNFSGQFLRASTLKGLLIHTADDLGRPGPDYQYGWGLINVKAAADVILGHKASLGSPKLIEGTITATNKVQTHTFTWDGTNAIRATLVWTDPAGVAQTNDADIRTRNLIHDLDLKVTAPNSNASLPYVMPFVGVWTTNAMTNVAVTGTNRVDNVERVDLPTPTQAGTYTVTVGMYGTNVLTTNQVYSLILSGGVNVPLNPPPSVTLDSPADGTGVLPGSTVNLAATAIDENVSGGPGVVTKVEFLNGTNVITEDFAAPYSFAWTAPGSGTYDLTARATDSEGAVSTSAAVRLVVLAGDGTPSIASFSPTSGGSGSSVVITGTNFANVTAVTFNGVPAASYTVDSATQISATVPASATTGPIGVTTGFGTAASASNFTVLQSPVVISQIYGAGGNTGALYNADYVELFNRSGSAVDLTGWSLQYASASGATWSRLTLSGSVGAGKYFLVKLAGGSSGSALPTPDLTSTLINMSGTQGKIGLRDSTTSFTGASPVGQAGLQDFVGFGAANASETVPAPSPSTTTAIFRAGDGATDTGNNAADFAASTPNPRNSSFGGGSAPVITSPLTAAGTVGTAFSYQISASGAPTSFGASGLPAGLSNNSATGLISGTPSIAGTNNVTISATNASGFDSKTLVLAVSPSGGGGGASYTVDFEDGTKASYASGSVTLNGISWNMTEALIGSGDANDFKDGLKSARLRGYSTSVMSMLADKSGGLGTISFQHRRYGTDSQVEWIVDYSTNAGAGWVEVGRFTPGTSAATFSAAANVTNSARIRIRTEASGASNRRANVDDITITSYAAASPVITASGALTNVHAVYGTASTNPASFNLSGAGMTAGILVTPPPGFEVSQTAGGASGYSSAQTVGAAGTISNTTLYLRLAAGTTVGSYSGNVVCSSAGATSVTVAVPPSNVGAKPLTITANNQNKPFGSSLTLGAGQTAFTPSGLVLGEEVGTVTLSASGGMLANDAAGTYEIVPSTPTGGTFSPSNYDISYVPGVLSVIGQTYAEWSSGLGNPAPGGNPDGDAYSNIEEYFLGLDSEAADPALAMDFESGLLSLDYRRNKNTQGVSGRVTWHPNLTDAVGWSTNGVTDVFLSDHGTYEMRRASVPVSPEESRRFLRLEVTEP